MPPGSAPALVIVVLAILPGALYTWAFEREAGSYGVSFADRTFRFLAVSAGFHLIAAWPEYGLYRAVFQAGGTVTPGQFALLWVGAIFLIALPAALGSVVGGLYRSRSTRSGWEKLRRHIAAPQEARLLRIFVGPEPAPRAWDDFFSERPRCYLRVWTTSDTWLAGKFASESYAGGFPNEQDLFLEEAYSVDDEGVLTAPLGYAVYIPGPTVAWVEVVPEEGQGQEDAGDAGS